MSIPTLEDGDAAPSADANVALYVPDGIYNTPDAPSEEDNESPGTISAPLTESIQTSLAPSSNMPVLKLCGVCKLKEFKYKCSRCYVPYCSLACSTVHKATHPVEITPPTQDFIHTPPVKSKPIARAGTVAASTIPSPFSQLDESAELKALFKHYPKLSAQLSVIWEAMQPPVTQSPDLYSKLTGKHNHQKSWNQDRGLEKGRKALDKAREAWGKDGEGVREYGELILRLVEGVNAEDLVRRELESENARIVKALMEGEF